MSYVITTKCTVCEETIVLSYVLLCFGDGRKNGWVVRNQWRLDQNWIGKRRAKGRPLLSQRGTRQPCETSCLYQFWAKLQSVMPPGWVEKPRNKKRTEGSVWGNPVFNRGGRMPGWNRCSWMQRRWQSLSGSITDAGILGSNRWRSIENLQ